MNLQNPKNPQNITAIITGSGRGIGKETALTSQVKNIVVCSRTKNEIDEVLNEIREKRSCKHSRTKM